jgi:DNA topoisomerase II
MWIKKKSKFELKEINYVPGLYKLFDEILVNAADNYQKDKSMDTIKGIYFQFEFF